MFRHVAVFLVLLFGSLFSGNVTRAQNFIEEAVTGTGEVTLRPLPSVLRARVRIESKGSTVATALARLKDRRGRALKKLEALGVDMESISISRPAVSKDMPAGTSYVSLPVPSNAAYGSFPSPNSPPAIARPMRSRLEEAPRLFTASTHITADWPLDEENVDELLIAAEALKTKIKAADLAGVKSPDKLTPEEQEILEETAPSRTSTVAVPYGRPTLPVPPSYYPYTVQTMRSGNPRFLFVAPISAEQRKAALAGAFTKAKAKATELAGAAGKRIGALVSLGGQVGENMAIQSVVTYTASGPKTENRPPVSKENEAGAADPDSLRFSCQVRATFRLQ